VLGGTPAEQQRHPHLAFHRPSVAGRCTTGVAEGRRLIELLHVVAAAREQRGGELGGVAASGRLRAHLR
jgi:hypothetical protein